MVNGLYTASRGMSNILAKQDVNAQNLSNTNTNGFKLARIVNTTSVTVGRNEEGKLSQREYQNISEIETSFVQGPMVNTGNKFDLALNNSGFMQVETPDGVGYTRNGSLSLNAMGELVTLSGKKVLDQDGMPIDLKGQDPSSNTVQFMEDGGVYVNGKKSATLGLVDFADTKKLKYGADGNFRNSDPVNNPPIAPETISVRSGFLEGSNVDPISTMITLMAEYRNYEADQKALKAEDETLGKAVNEVGKV